MSESKSERPVLSYRKQLQKLNREIDEDLFQLADDLRAQYDMFGDCCEFAKLYEEKTGNTSNGHIDVKFITRMVMDELKELEEAKDQAEQVDALLDAVYYILDHLAKTRLDIRPIWSLIHLANMTKFEKGHKDPNSLKWIKPKDFTPPDDDIREEIKSQLEDPESVDNPLLKRDLDALDAQNRQ